MPSQTWILWNLRNRLQHKVLPMWSRPQTIRTIRYSQARRRRTLTVRDSLNGWYHNLVRVGFNLDRIGWFTGFKIFSREYPRSVLEIFSHHMWYMIWQFQNFAKILRVSKLGTTLYLVLRWMVRFYAIPLFLGRIGLPDSGDKYGQACSMH